MPDPLPSEQLDAFAEAGQQAWPKFEVDAQAFVAHVAQLGAPSLERAADLYLAFACSAALEDALRAFDPILRAAVEATAVRVNPSPDFAAEVAQILRERLLVDRPPKISKYGGRAALRTWLGVMAQREAQRMRRRKGDNPKARADLSAATEAATDGPEGELLRARYRHHFADALRGALASLPPRDRALLRSHLVDGLSVEKLGEAHGVSKSTAARWLITARERLVEETRVRVQTHLRLTESEYESMAGVLRSDIVLSVARLLGSTR